MTYVARPDTQVVSTDHQTRRRALSAAAIGQGVEGFEFAVYGAAVPYLSHLFFPSASTTAALLATWAVFAIAFFIRPVGAYYWGSLGDRIGRRRVLATVILVMATATFLMGLIPSHGKIGFGAPLILIVLRLIQGFSLGGEATGSATYLAEFANSSTRARTVSVWQVASLVGVFGATLLTSAVISVIGEDSFAQFGWRILFMVTGLIGLVGLYLRLRLPDTPEFEALENQGNVAKAPLRESLAEHWRPMLLVAGLGILFNFGFYFALVYLPTLMSSSLGVDHKTITIATVVGVVLAIVVCPLSGWLADRVGRRTPLILGAGLAMLWAIPSRAVFMSSEAGAILAFTITVCIVAMYNSVYPTAMAELFPARNRYSGTSIAYGTSVAVFGGGGPYFATWLQSITGSSMAPFVLATLVALASLLVAVLALPETSRLATKAALA